MNQIPRGRLYKLLPAIYQLRDAVEGEPLRALLAVIEQEVETLEQDIGDLYDNWFIETCDNWVIPYIGDLLDVRALHVSSFPTNQQQNQLTTTETELSARPPQSRPYGQQERRAYVANTLAYRRRKGTTPVLEQLVRDVTGWRARAIEFSRLLLTTQHLNHLRPVSATVDLRETTSVERIGTPFEQQAAYTAEVRRASQGGQYNIPNIGLFVWRLQSYPIERSTARIMPFSLDDQPAGQFYTFNPLGYDDVSLFNQPQAETDITTQAQEINLPAPLHCSPLANELQERRQLRLQGKPLPAPRYFNESRPVLQIFVNGQPNPIPPEEILICRLAPTEDELKAAAAENQTDEEQNKPWRVPETDSEHSQNDFALPTKVVAVDPELGRLAFLDRPLPKRVEVSYLYGFSDDLGGGSYSRGVADPNLLKVTAQKQLEASNEATLINPLFWEVEQVTSVDENPLDTAIQAWNQTVSAWQGLRDQIHIPLARITIPPVQVSQIKPNQVRRKFKPGIVGNGLEVLPGCCASQVLITPGLAIDRQGRRLQVGQIETFDLSKFDLSVYPNQTGLFLLVIFYRAALEGQHYPFALVPQTAINDGYPPGTFIPLAQLRLSSDQQLIGQPDLSVRRLLKFQPGIVQGLEVSVRPGTLEAIITPGIAVDLQGRVLVADSTTRFDLDPGIAGLLVAFRTDRSGQQWQLRFVSEASADLAGFICLAHLDIPRLEVRVEPISPIVGDVNPPRTGIIDGLEIGLAGGTITITPGTAQDSQGREIKLEHDYQFDLSSYAARQLVLFISRHKRQGLPLEPVSHANGSDWQQLGIVPVEPNGVQADTGIILIKDNLTYEGDLAIAIPQAKQLNVIAADGCRPHIQGNVVVQGTAPTDEPNQGELLLDGLLIEGQLQVLPGNLQRLQVNHSTLVPEQGGLQVQRQEAPVGCGFDQEDPFVPIAVAMTVLAFIRGLLRSNTGLGRFPEKHLGQLTQLVMQQMTRLISEIWQILCPWAAKVDSSLDSQNYDWDCLFGASSSRQDTNPLANSRLEISLYRSICGSLDLIETVPKLRIEDCILDKGQARNNVAETSGLAIWAPGTDAEIFSTTVQGMMTVRNLEASNSLFTEKVTVGQHQTGCMRFSYVPEGSKTPPRYQCQPDMAFKAALDPIPTAITSIAIHARSEVSQNSGNLEDSSLLLTGSAGGGVFRSLDNGTTWQNVNRSLANRYVNALLAYAQPGIGEVKIENPPSSNPSGDEQEQTKIQRTVKGVCIPATNPEAFTTAFLQQLRPGDSLTIAGQTWRITEVLSDSELICELNVKGAIDDVIKSIDENNSQVFHINTLLAGTTGGNIFRSKNDGDNWTPVVVAGITATITALRQNTLTLTGTLKGQEITVNRLLSESEVQIGDTVTVFKVKQEEKQQSRLIKAIRVEQQAQTSTQSTILTLNAPFFEDNQTSEIKFCIHALLVATAGNGILRANSNGENWIQTNSGLTNWDVRALAVNAEGQIFAGTTGDGVFQLIHEESGDKCGDRWMPLNNGLKNHNITALIIDSDGIIFVGTAGSGVFYFNPDEERWIAINQDLTSLDISALVANDKSLVVATTDGKSFHWVDREQRWEQLSLDLKGLDITALVIGPSHHNLFAGTAAGNILRFDTELRSTGAVGEAEREKVNFLNATRYEGASGRWLSINLGLKNVTEKLLLMERLQPTFTSTRYGDSGYAQLSQNCAGELRTGAEDGAEMGVFYGLKQPQRETNLQANIEEYLRFGLEAGIFYIT